MARINLKANIISDDGVLNINTSGIRSKNKIIYKENNVTVTILIFNNRIEMNRCCNEYEIYLIFDKNKDTISTYSLFGNSKKFNLETSTHKLKITKNLIEIVYNLEGNKFEYKMEVEDLWY